MLVRVRVRVGARACTTSCASSASCALARSRVCAARRCCSRIARSPATATVAPLYAHSVRVNVLYTHTRTHSGQRPEQCSDFAHAGRTQLASALGLYSPPELAAIIIARNDIYGQARCVGRRHQDTWSRLSTSCAAIPGLLDPFHVPLAVSPS